MTAFRALVWLYVRDLSRRRLLWVVGLVVVAGIALNYWAARELEEAVGAGQSWGMATRRAASHLEQLASTLRSWTPLVVVIVASVVAPESRRNGTTTFLLSMGVCRETVAASQFTALALLIAAMTLAIHATFVMAGVRTDSVSLHDALLAWPGLFLPLAGVAAAVLAFSLTASTVETLLLFLGVPFLTEIMPHLVHLPRRTPMFLVRALDNVALLFPETGDVVAWPHATFGGSDSAPAGPTAFLASILHLMLAVAFWVVLGLYRHRHHDVGSRTALK